MVARRPRNSKALDIQGLLCIMAEDRIIYYVQDDILKVDLIGKRNDDDVYKQLRRL